MVKAEPTADEDEWSKEQEANRKPGQKHPTPSQGFADRVFYESLFEQVPSSPMAKKWCVEYGVLSKEDAEKACKEMGIVTTTNKRKAGASSKSAKSPKKEKKIKDEK